MQEVKVFDKVERHDDDSYRKDVLYKEESHTDTYRLSVGADGPHRGDGCPVVVSDVRINGREDRHAEYESQRKPEVEPGITDRLLKQTVDGHLGYLYQEPCQE